METHFRTISNRGRPVGRTHGEIMGRRFRPGIITASTTACMKSMRARPRRFWHRQRKNHSTPEWVRSCSAGLSIFTLRTSIHCCRLWTSAWKSRQASACPVGSGATGTQMEYDLFSRNNGSNTGRAGWGTSSTGMTVAQRHRHSGQDRPFSVCHGQRQTKATTAQQLHRPQGFDQLRLLFFRFRR